MNRVAALSLVTMIALASCSGAGPVVGTTPATVDQVTPYQLPIVTDPAVQNAQRVSNTADHVQESYGGIPAQAFLIDATKFPPGSQVNFAILSVSAVANGATYPIVQYLFPVVINVLDFQNAALLLGIGIIPEIQYSGVQYVIDPAESSVVLNGHVYPMSFGSVASSTFTPMAGGHAALYFPAPVNAANTAPDFLVDFNAATWVTINGGTADVAPSGDGTVLSQSAIIQGKILNDAGGPVVGAVVSAYGPDGVIVNSAPSDDTGTFQIHAISGNSYSLIVWNTYAPVNGVITQTATGNDPVGWTVKGPFVSVPSGYLVNVGTIRD